MKLIGQILAGALSVLIIWELAILIFHPATYVFPAPLQVFQALQSQGDILWNNSLYTVTEVLIGFILANAISLLIALVVAFIPKIENPMTSLAVTLKTIPIIAIAPLLVLWFGSGIWSKVVAVIFVCFFPALVNILRGIKSLDADLHQLFRVYSVSKFQLIKLFIMPGILPYLFSALKVSSSLAIIGAIVGEFISANKGLGFLIVTNYYSLNIPMVFACILITSFMGIILYHLIGYIEGKTVPSLTKLDEAKS